MIFHVQAHAKDLRYGKALNNHIQYLPDDSWILVRDLDTLVFNYDYTQILEQAIKDNPDCDLFTCKTNRAYGQGFDSDSNIVNHYKRSTGLELKYKPLTGVIPAFFLLFKKSLWLKNRFDDHPIIKNRNSFDVRWMRGMKNISIIQIEHLYIFHYYRLHKHRKDHMHLI